MDLELLLRTPHVDTEHDFDISPQGDRLVFSWNLSGNWEIYEMPLDGSSSPGCLTCGTGGKFAPRYSPDGFHLAYAVDPDGSENYRIQMVDLETKEVRDLTEGIITAMQPNFSWSPDGKMIAFISMQAGIFRVCIQQIKGRGKVRSIDFTQPIWNVLWSPKGDQLVVVLETAGSDLGIEFVNIERGAKYRLSLDGEELNAKNPAWSPDGTELAFSSNRLGFYNIGIFELESGLIRWVSEGSQEKTKAAWAPNGKGLAYIQWERGNRKLVIQNLEDKPAAYVIEPGLHNNPLFTPDGNRVVLTFENPSHPPDLWSFSLQDGVFSQLTNSKPALLDKFEFVMPEEVTYPGKDGVAVPAMLYRPNRWEKSTQYPGKALVYIHGGPDWLIQAGWDPIMSFMTNRGWVVLAPNYRGSTGYGRKWQTASRYEMGRMDCDDVAAGAQYLMREKLADPGHITIAGRSHGGYLTMSCMTRYPGLWASGVAVVPVLNLFRSHAESREDLQMWNIQNYGDPVENHTLWVERSPFFFLERIEAPVLFIVGSNDIRCPAGDAITAHLELQSLGKTSDLLLYPDEGHVFLKIDNVIDSANQLVEFLCRNSTRQVEDKLD
jgi:dipeptidyl aminopeptidase/acylaminoacyl peptidase